MPNFCYFIKQAGDGPLKANTCMAKLLWPNVESKFQEMEEDDDVNDDDKGRIRIGPPPPPQFGCAQRIIMWLEMCGGFGSNGHHGGGQRQ